MSDKQYFQTDGYEDDAAEQFWLKVPVGDAAKAQAHPVAQKGKQQRDEADGTEWKQQLDKPCIARKGHCHPDAQRIDACGHGQHQLRGELLWVEVRLLLGPERLVDHSPSDKTKQREGNPPAIFGHMMAETDCQQPAQQWHQRLEHAEQQRHATCEVGGVGCEVGGGARGVRHVMIEQAGGNGHSKAVHSQCNSEQQDVNKGHHRLLVLINCKNTIKKGNGKTFAAAATK